MRTRFFAIIVLASSILIAACGGEDTPPSGASSGTAATGGTGGSAGTGGTGGTGGVGGSADVDPISGIGPVEKVSAQEFSYEFLEGPLWIPKDEVILFADIPQDVIYKYTPASGMIVEFRKPSGRANGLALDNNGLLIACEHLNRRVSRTLADDTVVTVADSWQGKKLNSPNDVIVREDGNIYFTDPPYGLDGNPQDLNFQGVFRIAPDGAMTLVVDDMNRPNGIALSPDRTKLYVSDSETPEVRVFPVNEDGSTGPGSKLIDRTSDGMAIDEAGNLYLTNGEGVEVFRSDGTKRGAVPVPESTTNVSFGGSDRKTLYITAGKSLYRVNLNVPGLP